MKKLLTQFISSTSNQPIKQGSLNHLQESYQEAIAAIVKNLIINRFGVYTLNKMYILYGCVNTSTPPIYTITEGAIFFNGEIYLVDAVTFTLAGTDVGICTVDESFVVAGNADPTIFSDGSINNVHAVRKIIISYGDAGTGDANLSDVEILSSHEEWEESSSTTGCVLTAFGGSKTLTSVIRKWIIIGNTCTLQIFAKINVSPSNGYISLEFPLPVNTKTYTPVAGIINWGGAGVHTAGDGVLSAMKVTVGNSSGDRNVGYISCVRSVDWSNSIEMIGQVSYPIL